MDERVGQCFVKAVTLTSAFNKELVQSCHLSLEGPVRAQLQIRTLEVFPRIENILTLLMVLSLVGILIALPQPYHSQ